MDHSKDVESPYTGRRENKATRNEEGAGVACEQAEQRGSCHNKAWRITAHPTKAPTGELWKRAGCLVDVGARVAGAV